MLLPPPEPPTRHSSHHAPRGRRLFRSLPPLPAAAALSPAVPRPPRKLPAPTSGYRRQPPRLWHYGHGGGDGSAEAEQARHQGAGIVPTAFLSKSWRGLAGGPPAGGTPSRSGQGERVGAVAAVAGLRFRSSRGPGGSRAGAGRPGGLLGAGPRCVRRGPGLTPVTGGGCRAACCERQLTAPGCGVGQLGTRGQSPRPDRRRRGL